MHSDEKGKQVEIGPTRRLSAGAAVPGHGGRRADGGGGAVSWKRGDEQRILVGRGGKLRYWHLTFQEFLAAKALAGRDEDRRRLLFAEGKTVPAGVAGDGTAAGRRAVRPGNRADR